MAKYNYHLLKAHRRQHVELRRAHMLQFNTSESPRADGVGIYCSVCHRLIAVHGAHVGDDTYTFTYNKGAGTLCAECERKLMSVDQPVWCMTNG